MNEIAAKKIIDLLAKLERARFEVVDSYVSGDNQRSAKATEEVMNCCNELCKLKKVFPQLLENYECSICRLRGTLLDGDGRDSVNNPGEFES